MGLSPAESVHVPACVTLHASCITSHIHKSMGSASSVHLCRDVTLDALSVRQVSGIAVNVGFTGLVHRVK